MKTHAPGQTSKAILSLRNICSQPIGNDARLAAVHFLSGGGQFDSSQIKIEFAGISKDLTEAFRIDIP